MALIILTSLRKRSSQESPAKVAARSVVNRITRTQELHHHNIGGKVCSSRLLRQFRRLASGPPEMRYVSRVHEAQSEIGPKLTECIFTKAISSTFVGLINSVSGFFRKLCSCIHWDQRPLPSRRRCSKFALPIHNARGRLAGELKLTDSASQKTRNTFPVR